MNSSRTEIIISWNKNKNTLATFASAGAASLIAGITTETILKNVKPSHWKSASRAILGVSVISAAASFAYVRKHRTFSQDLHVL